MDSLRNGYRALVLDLDGTLIGRDQRISSRVGEVVGRASAITSVSIATGREPADVLRFARQLGLTTPQVSDNGALILDPADGTEVWSAPLLPAQARHIVTWLYGQGVPFMATHAGGVITSLAEITHWNLTRVSALDVSEQTADRVLAAFASSLDLHVVKVYLPYNRLWAVDFTRAGVNKGTAIKVLAKMAGIDISTIIAVGDSYNDLPLLRVCGLRVVMGHAPDELKAIADYIAPTVDEDGLAVALEEFVLPRLKL